MNIGIFTDTYHPRINGVVTSIRMLEKELAKLGHRTFIFTTTDPNAVRNSFNVFRLPSMPLTFLPPHRVAILYSPKLLLKMKYLRLDVIHTHTEFPMGIFGKLVSRIYRIPMVHTYHTMYEDYTHYAFNGYLITPKMAQRFSRVFCNRAKVVIAPADKTHTYLKEIGVNKPIKMIPTGLDFAPFAAENFSEGELARTKLELGIELDDPVIISVGRVAKEKSLDVLVETMPKLLDRLPQTKLVIVGEGPMLSNLKQMAESLGIQRSVIFTGAKPWDAIGKYYRLGDVFATASTSETQGLTHIEAMASSVPVVVKKDPSFENLIRHKDTGFIFEKDEDAADILYHALINKDEASKTAKSGFEAIQSFSARQYALDVEKVYRIALDT
ncbi:MAG: glycosyltransferase family 4 protein [Defluviitaleaceae bacterium]|nr:glycosyltransferase family 4 protein [Defluviitaleaceae bacterium]